MKKFQEPFRWGKVSLMLPSHLGKLFRLYAGVRTVIAKHLHELRPLHGSLCESCSPIGGKEEEGHLSYSGPRLLSWGTHFVQLLCNVSVCLAENVVASLRNRLALDPALAWGALVFHLHSERGVIGASMMHASQVPLLLKVLWDTLSIPSFSTRS